MSNSSNTTWIVSCITMRSRRNGSVDILHCDGRSYRNEKYARDRLESIVKSFEEAGYSLEEICCFGEKTGEGVCACKNRGGIGNEYSVAFLTRNPVWSSQ